jgi:hypothetical protein
MFRQQAWLWPRLMHVLLGAVRIKKINLQEMELGDAFSP